MVMVERNFIFLSATTFGKKDVELMTQLHGPEIIKYFGTQESSWRQRSVQALVCHARITKVNNIFPSARIAAELLI
jgi:hypothetical protein